MKHFIRITWPWIATIFFWIILALLLASCTTVRTVTVPEYHEVVVHSQDTTSRRDSVFVHDSICITHWGDTILQKEYHVVYKDRWRDRLRVDSFIQRDTVIVVKEVQKPPNRWQQTKMRLGITLIWMLLTSATFFVIRIIIYRYKRG